MAWGQKERDRWLSEQVVKRSYLREVASKIHALEDRFQIVPYGALSINPQLYPLYLLKTKDFNSHKKTILITGGVHGYETSGVHGALDFLDRSADQYSESFNFACAPCVSPWAYETINRWNPNAIDPNRSFRDDSPAEECKLLLDILKSEGILPFAHFDLHETTDTDNTVFRPALEQRDGVAKKFSEIPDGFYVVGDSENSQPTFQKAIVDAVRKVTHIAKADDNGRLIGDLIEQEGVINYPVKRIFLCAGLSGAKYATTTEVYPDSSKVTAAICVDAQIAAIEGGLDYLIKNALLS